MKHSFFRRTFVTLVLVAACGKSPAPGAGMNSDDGGAGNGTGTIVKLPPGAQGQGGTSGGEGGSPGSNVGGAGGRGGAPASAGGRDGGADAPSSRDAGPDAPTTACTPSTAPCMPSNPCLVGVRTCEGGVEICKETTVKLANGAMCGTGMVCKDGTCQGCAAGTECPVASNPCHAGVTVCSSGAPVCNDVGNARDGSNCGGSKVCSKGSCIACAGGTACQVDGSCKEGALDCAGGVATCKEGTRNVAAGDSCGSQKVCNSAGACIACLQGGVCDVPGRPCVKGQVNCKTGQAVCEVAGNKPAGDDCGGGVCDGAGACVACAKGMTCKIAAKPCILATISCGSGTPQCFETGVAAGNGSPCNDQGTAVCSNGQCLPCTPNKVCTPAQGGSPCKAYLTSCTTGQELCVEVGNKTAGSDCGTALTCSGGTRKEADRCDGAGACVPGLMTANTCGASCAVCDATSQYCNGTTCVAKKAIAAACAQSPECTSALCASGFCCHKAANGKPAGSCPVTDANRDGFPDVVAINPSGVAVRFMGNGKGGWSNPVALSVTPNFAGYDVVLAVGDFDARDGNHSNDLFARKGDTIAVFRGNGAGDWDATPGSSGGVGWAVFDALLAPRDWDGNRTMDVMVRLSGAGTPDVGTVSLCPGDGAGSLTAPCGTISGPGWNGFDLLMGVGDFDGNGTPDIVARGKAGGTTAGKVFLVKGNGTGGWGSNGVVIPNLDWSAFDAGTGLGDFDGDGTADVALKRGSNGDLLLCKGNGSGGFANTCDTVIGQGWGGFREIRGVW